MLENWTDLVRTRQDKLNYLKAYRERNKDRISQQKKDWYLLHREEQLKKMRLNYEVKKDDYISRAKDWSIKNPEKRSIIRNNWRVKNKEHCNMLGKLYRERKKSNGIFYGRSKQALYDKFGGICQICSKVIDLYIRYPDSESLSIDHIIPVSKGGMTIESNLQIAHFGCNVRKGNKYEA